MQEKKKSSVALYIRFARDPGEEQRNEMIQLQTAILTEYAAKMGWHPPMAVWSDIGFSGLNMNRPGLERLLRAIKNEEIDICLVHDISRLSRDVKDLSSILSLTDRHHVDIVSVKEGTMQKERFLLNALRMRSEV